MGGIKWSDTEDALISKLISEGYSSTEILPKLKGRTISGLKRRIFLLGVMEKPHQTKKSEKLQTGKPKGTFKRGDPHPKFPNLFYINWNYRSNSEYWSDQKILEKKKDVLKLWKQKNSKDFSEKFFKKWSDAEDALISKLINQGYSSTEILPKLKGRTISGLKRRISLLGVVDKSHQTKKSERLQTGKPKGTFKRGDPHPEFPNLVYINWSPRKNSEYWSTAEKLKRDLIYAQRWKEDNESTIIEYRKKTSRHYSRLKTLKTKEKREQATVEINKFFKDNEIPKKDWLKKEFANEKDLQIAVAHVLVQRFGLFVEFWRNLGEHGYPDLFLPDMDLILEIKLSRATWTKKSIINQVNKYNEISETWIICLDKSPTWAKKIGLKWLTPLGLFSAMNNLINA